MYVWETKIVCYFQLYVKFFQVRERGRDTRTQRTPTEGLHHIRGSPAGDEGDPLEETPSRLFPVTVFSSPFVTCNAPIPFLITFCKREPFICIPPIPFSYFKQLKSDQNLLHLTGTVSVEVTANAFTPRNQTTGTHGFSSLMSSADVKRALQQKTITRQFDICPRSLRRESLSVYIG